MNSTATRAALLGAAIGARSMVGLAALALTTPAGARPGWVGWLGSWWGRGLTTAAAVGEVLADKSPRLPSRVAPPVLAQRLVVGGLGGQPPPRRWRTWSRSGWRPGRVVVRGRGGAEPVTPTGPQWDRSMLVTAAIGQVYRQ